MKKSRTEQISETLQRLSSPSMTPRRLLKEARRAHPEATKKEIVRAAFYSVIVYADSDPQKAKQLQSFAISERVGDELDTL